MSKIKTKLSQTLEVPQTTVVTRSSSFSSLPTPNISRGPWRGPARPQNRHCITKQIMPAQPTPCKPSHATARPPHNHTKPMTLADDSAPVLAQTLLKTSAEEDRRARARHPEGGRSTRRPGGTHPNPRQPSSPPPASNNQRQFNATIPNI